VQRVGVKFFGYLPLTRADTLSRPLLPKPTASTANAAADPGLSRWARCPPARRSSTCRSTRQPPAIAYPAGDAAKGVTWANRNTKPESGLTAHEVRSTRTRRSERRPTMYDEVPRHEHPQIRDLDYDLTETKRQFDRQIDRLERMIDGLRNQLRDLRR
jgi:hypothetical protein